MKNWIRKIVRPTVSTIRKPRRLMAQPQILALEDRTTPTIAIGATAPYNAAFTITEGDTVAISGSWQDSNAAATTFTVDTIPTASTLAVANIVSPLTSNVPLRNGTFTFDYTPIDGVTNVGIPPVNSFQIYGYNDKNEFSSPSLIQPRILNAAPVFSTAPANQFALNNIPTNINLGTFTDKGVNDNVTVNGWKVDIDWNNDNTYDETAYYAQGSNMPIAKTFTSPGVNTVKVRITDKDSGFVVSAPFTVTVSDYASPTYVDGAWTGYSNGTIVDIDPVTAGIQPGTIGFDAFATISSAVSFTAPTGTINVAAGNYAETPTLSKAVTILGPNASIAGSGLRGAEAKVYPAASANAVFTVLASDVTIRGLLIDGDAPTVGTPVYSGADANVFYGITNGNTAGGTPINNLLVQNNIIQHTAIGVFANSDSNPLSGGGNITLTLSTGNVIDHNLLQDIGVFDFGYAVSLRNDFNANVTDNVMRRVYSGISVNNNSSAAPGSQNFTGNTIESYGGGAWLSAYW